MRVRTAGVCCICSRIVAVAIEGQDAVALLAVSVRIGRNCSRTKGTLSKLEPVAIPQVSKHRVHRNCCAHQHRRSCRCRHDEMMYRLSCSMLSGCCTGAAADKSGI